jgi:hypothetical protein
MHTRRTAPVSRPLAPLAATAAALAATLALAASAHAQGAAPATPPSPGTEAAVPAANNTGPQCALGDFSRLRIEGSIDVDAHPGAHPGAVVHGPARIVPLIEAVVSGDTLVVRWRHDANVVTFGHGDDVRVDVEFTQLTGTQQHGSGDLHITALAAPQLDSQISGSGDLKIDNAQLGKLAVSIAGSGDVSISGKADEAKFSTADSGDVSADHLVARRVKVEIRGSGDVRVNATDALDARVAGSGDVTYRGHPHDISRNIAGSGSIQAGD